MQQDKNYNSDEIRKLYRDHMRREVKSSSVQNEKKQFIAEHFEKPGLFIFRPAVMMPAMSLAAILVVLFLFHKPVSQVQEAVSLNEIPAEEETYISPATRPDYTKPQLYPVEVQRITSNTGSTMVYQRFYHNTPITVIWVFPGGHS